MKTSFKTVGFIYLTLVFASFFAFHFKSEVIDAFNFYFNTKIHSPKYIVTFSYFILMPGVVLAVSQIMLITLPKRIKKLRLNYSSKAANYSLKLILYFVLILLTFLIVFLLLKIFYKDIVRHYTTYGLGFFSGNPYYLSSKWLVNWIFSIIAFPGSFILALILIAYKRGVFKTKTLLGTDSIIIKNHQYFFNILQISLIILVCLFHFASAYKHHLYFHVLGTGDLSLIVNLGLFLLVYIALLRSSFINLKTHIVFLTTVVVFFITLFSVTSLYYARLPGFDPGSIINNLPVGSPLLMPYKMMVLEVYGRYSPLAHVQYNWLTLTPLHKFYSAYYIEMLALMMLVLYLTWFSLKLEVVKNKVILLLTLFTSLCLPMFLLIYSEPAYSENIEIFLLSFFVLLFILADKKRHKYSYYIMSVLVLAVATYTKEPVFLIGLVIGAGLLIFKGKKLSRPELVFIILLLINSILFLILFKFAGIGNPGMPLNISTIKHNIDNLYYGVFTLTNGALIIPIVIAVIRLYMLVFKKEKLLKADLILFAGVVYTCFYLFLSPKNGTEYYYAPGLLLATFSIAVYANTIYNSYLKRKSLIKVIVLLIFPLQVIISLSNMSYSMSNINKTSAKNNHDLYTYLYHILDSKKEFKLSKTRAAIDILYVEVFAERNYIPKAYPQYNKHDFDKYVKMWRNSIHGYHHKNMSIYDLILGMENIFYKKHNYHTFIPSDTNFIYLADSGAAMSNPNHDKLKKRLVPSSAVILIQTKDVRPAYKTKQVWLHSDVCSNSKVYSLGQGYYVGYDTVIYLYVTAPLPKVKFATKPKELNVKRCN